MYVWLQHRRCRRSTLESLAQAPYLYAFIVKVECCSEVSNVFGQDFYSGNDAIVPYSLRANTWTHFAFSYVTFAFGLLLLYAITDMMVHQYARYTSTARCVQHIRMGSLQVQDRVVIFELVLKRLPLPGTSTNTQLGQSTYGTQQNMIGLLDEVVLYPSLLSDANVTNLFNAYGVGTVTNMTAVWCV